MLFRFQLEDFTQEEIDFILYLFNVVYPIGIEVDYEVLLSIKDHKLAQKIISCEPKLSDSGKPIWKSICQKLNIKV